MANIIDLFSGCGGMSLGFSMAGFKPILAIEKDAWAAETYSYNFNDTTVIVDDITQLSDLSGLGLDNVEIEGILSGSPCQGFSFSGKRDRNDPRNSLFMEFVRFVKYFQPKFCLMENVNGILSMKTLNGFKVKDIVVEEMTKAGYDVTIYRLNAADFGVPQSRPRVFFLGFRKDLGITNFELTPTRLAEPYVTVAEAIMDLPQIEAKEGSEEMDYTKEPMNEYQKLMRLNSIKVYNHIAMNHSDRIVERFKHIGIGQSESDVAEEFAPRQRGNAGKVSGKSFHQNSYRPYPDKPSPTIPASFQSNFVRPYLNRNYTPREGARLQSFPDSFVFKGKRMSMSWEKYLNQYHQIGNAVPPLLAKGIAEQIKGVIYD